MVNEHLRRISGVSPVTHVYEGDVPKYGVAIKGGDVYVAGERVGRLVSIQHGFALAPTVDFLTSLDDAPGWAVEG